MGDILVCYWTLLSILFPHSIVVDLNGRYDMFRFWGPTSICLHISSFLISGIRLARTHLTIDIKLWHDSM